jgi:hypothetical protein
MNTTDIQKMISAMEERINERFDKQEERIKKLYKSTGTCFKELNDKIEGLDLSSSSKSEKPSKKDKPKREQSDGQKAWTDYVKQVWAEMKEDDPKATYKDAMSEASRRKDSEDPEGAKKRAAAREKRSEAKERKSAGSSKSASKAASEDEASGSESEAPAPKKKTSKK